MPKFYAGDVDVRLAVCDLQDSTTSSPQVSHSGEYRGKLEKACEVIAEGVPLAEKAISCGDDESQMTIIESDHQIPFFMTRVGPPNTTSTSTLRKSSGELTKKRILARPSSRRVALLPPISSPAGKEAPKQLQGASGPVQKTNQKDGAFKKQAEDPVHDKSSLGGTSSTGTAESEIQALSVHVNMSKAALCRLKREDIIPDAKVEIYLNGHLAATSVIESQVQEYNKTISGSRSSRLLEQAWTLCWPGKGFNTTTTQQSDHKRKRTDCGVLTERWKAIADSLLKEAQLCGKDSSGLRTPNANYLLHLAAIPPPQSLLDDPTFNKSGQRYAVIDVVVTAGRYSRLPKEKGFVSGIERLMDPTCQFDGGDDIGWQRCRLALSQLSLLETSESSEGLSGTAGLEAEPHSSGTKFQNYHFKPKMKRASNDASTGASNANWPFEASGIYPWDTSAGSASKRVLGHVDGLFSERTAVPDDISTSLPRPDKDPVIADPSTPQAVSNEPHSLLRDQPLRMGARLTTATSRPNTSSRGLLLSSPLATTDRRLISSSTMPFLAKQASKYAQMWPENRDHVARLLPHTFVNTESSAAQGKLVANAFTWPLGQRPYTGPIRVVRRISFSLGPQEPFLSRLLGTNYVLSKRPQPRSTIERLGRNPLMTPLSTIDQLGESTITLAVGGDAAAGSIAAAEPGLVPSTPIGWTQDDPIEGSSTQESPTDPALARNRAVKFTDGGSGSGRSTARRSSQKSSKNRQRRSNDQNRVTKRTIKLTLPKKSGSALAPGQANFKTPLSRLRAQPRPPLKEFRADFLQLISAETAIKQRSATKVENAGSTPAEAAQSRKHDLRPNRAIAAAAAADKDIKEDPTSPTKAGQSLPAGHAVAASWTIPPLTQGSIVSYASNAHLLEQPADGSAAAASKARGSKAKGAEKESALGPAKGKEVQGTRQVKAERRGLFEEHEVVVGMRFVLGGEPH